MDKSNKYKTMFYFFGKQDWPQNVFLILIDQTLLGLSVQQRQTGLLEIKYIACMFQINFEKLIKLSCYLEVV